MADILETKLDQLAMLTTEARAILDDEREAMRRECEARVALAVADRDAAERKVCDVFGEARAMREAAEAARDAAERKVCEMREAITSLMDVQNGPPLERDTDEWNDAMSECVAVLAYSDDIASRWVPVAERDAAIARAEKAEARARRRLLDEAAPTPSNARVVVDHLVLAGVLDTYAVHLAQQRPQLTVPQAVALQTLLGDHLPEGAIVIEGSSPLDPEESTETGPWVVAMSEAAELFAGDHRWDRLSGAHLYRSKQAAAIEAGGIGGAVVLTHAEALEVTRGR